MKKKQEASKDKMTTLLMYQIGDKPKNFDALMEVANKRIAEKMNVQLDLQYIGWGDYEKKMSVIVSSGENYDIAMAKNYVTNAQKGAYADLTELLPKYASEAYEMLDEGYKKGNEINGKMYSFPVNADISINQKLTFNKTLLDKYDLDISKVKQYADLEPLLKVIKEKEPQVTPIAIGQGFRAESVSGYDYPLGNGMPFAVEFEGEDTAIFNPFDRPEMLKSLNAMHRFYEAGYVPKDADTSNRVYPLEADTWFVRQETEGPYNFGDYGLSVIAGKELVSKPITKPYKTPNAAQGAAFVVSSGSKNTEKAVELLGLLNSDAELLNGLVLGIEGDAWEKVENNRMRLLDGYQPNMHMSGWNTGNNKILYVDEMISDERIKERDEVLQNSKESPMLGFNFKTDKVKNELSNINNVMTQYLDGLSVGTLEAGKTVPEMNKKLATAGYATVLKEMQKQYDEFKAQQ
ncbi:ABC transporter substrate-binding protein [Brochothrix campestris]|uniref:ABC transporter substrate-binding protein n=1 Tax=Brochothrix campestris TaxID=2757 RepID=UPI0004B2F5F7|nr:ABC transporter substrate-binding protein [Brochothrix campestris]